MRKRFTEFFYISENGKIREEAMITRVATTAVVMLMCLAAMSFSAYAFFSYNFTSGANVIRAANFDIEVEIRDITDGTTQDDTDDESKPVRIKNSNSFEAKLKADKKYEITLRQTAESEATTGFVIITARGDSDEKVFHTQQVGKNEKGKFTFTISTNADYTVTFLAHWGTSSHYDGYMHGENNELYITDKNKEIELLIKGAESSDSEKEETTTAPAAESTTKKSSTETTKPAETSTQASTTEPSTSPVEPTTTKPVETTTAAETTAAETTEETQPTTENTEPTEVPTTEASE